MRTRTRPGCFRPAVAAMAGSALILTACGSTASSAGSSGRSNLASVSMGIEPWIGYAPWYIAQKEGYFAKYGLSVNIVNFQQDADRNAALIAGRTNVSNIDTGRTIQFASKGEPGVPLLLEDDSNGADAIMSVKSISAAAQLFGQPGRYDARTPTPPRRHSY